MHGFRRRQSVIATSSAVAEYYAGPSVAEDLLFFRELCMFFDFDPYTELRLDSSAARGIAKRKGDGKEMGR